MPNEPPTAPAGEEQSASPSLADMDLATYRAHREAAGDPAAAAQPEQTASKTPESDEPSEDASRDEDESESTEQATDAKPKGKGGFQKKISKLTAERDELRRQLAERESAAAKPAEGAVEAKPAETAAAPSKPKPKLEDFASLEEWGEALTTWQIDKREAERIAAAAESKAKEENQKLVSTWNERKRAAEERHPDYGDRMEAVSDVKLNAVQQRIILESEYGPEVAYELAKDPKELQRVVALPPLAFAREIGKIESRVGASSDESEPEQPRSRVSAAPAPMRPVSAARPALGSFDVTKAGLADYRRARESGKLR